MGGLSQIYVCCRNGEILNPVKVVALIFSDSVEKSIFITVAGILGEEKEKVFKTLVTQGKSGTYYVFVAPEDLMKVCWITVADIVGE